MYMYMSTRVLLNLLNELGNNSGLSILVHGVISLPEATYIFFRDLAYIQGYLQTPFIP